MKCDETGSLLEMMIIAMGKFALDRQKYYNLEQIAHKCFVEKLNMLLCYVPELKSYFVPESQVQEVETIDVEFEYID